MITATQPVEQTSSSTPSPGLPVRLWAVPVVLAAECLTLAQIPHPWLTLQQPMAAPIVFLASLLFFARRRLAALRLHHAPITKPFLVLHLLALGLVLAATALLLRSPASVPALALWCIALALLPSTLIAACVPLAALPRIVRSLGSAWLYAALSTAVAISARIWIVLLWDAPSPIGHALQSATFRGVHALLTLLYGHVVADPATCVLGTARFQVIVSGACSGIEGCALMLILTTAWLIYARRELRLPRALWLIPLALGLTWILNLARIAALIAIGDAGHPELALNGFHSEAGWILFNVVAIAFLVAAQHIPSLRRAHTASQHDSAQQRTAAACLLPYLAIVATSMLTKAFSQNFESLYVLRFAAALAVLWFFRRDYRKLTWSVTWVGPATGAVVILLWIALAHTLPTHASPQSSLAHLAPWQRILWIAARAAAAITTVPLAEELAFRAYLARRIVSANVETVSFRALTLPAIVLSSLAFGLLHGSMAVAGTLAGLAFALAAKRRGSFGEAVAAHATANLILAAWVLSRGDYSLW